MACGSAASHKIFYMQIHDSIMSYLVHKKKLCSIYLKYYFILKLLNKKSLKLECQNQLNHLEQ